MTQTGDEFREEMQDVVETYSSNDTVSWNDCHDHMLDVMCRLLTELGYSAGVKVYKDTHENTIHI